MQEKNLKLFLYGILAVFLMALAVFLFFLNPAANLASLCGGSGDISCPNVNLSAGCGGSGDTACNTGGTGGGKNAGGGSGGGGRGGTVVPPITQPIAEPAKPLEAEKQVFEPVKKVAKEVKKIIETPQGSVATKTISTVGATVAAAQVAAAVALSPFDFLMAFIRLSGIFLTAMGLKKRVKPWGVVYDSSTKQPIDPAYVTLKDINGKEISSAITDLDGRYGFLAPPGIYQMLANKTNYIFPSKKLFGKTEDELYSELYFGGSIEIKHDGQAITKNIPMDALKFDWNEFAKRDKKLMRFYSKLDIIMRRVFDWFFVIGFVVAAAAYFAVPYPYNSIILMIYLALLLLRVIGVKPKAYGRISDGLNGYPMSFAVLRVLTPDSNIEIARKVADKYGRYYCLVPKGQYYVRIEKKEADGSYSLGYISAVIDATKKGIIKNNFKI